MSVTRETCVWMSVTRETVIRMTMTGECVTGVTSDAGNSKPGIDFTLIEECDECDS